MHPLAPVGTLFAVTVWPFLAAFLLLLTPENRQSASSLTLLWRGSSLRRWLSGSCRERMRWRRRARVS